MPGQILRVSLFVYFRRDSPEWVRASSFTRFLDHTQRRTTVGRTPLDELSASRRDLYLQTHNTHNRQTSLPPEGFETTISAGERPQTYSLDRAAIGTGSRVSYPHKKGGGGGREMHVNICPQRGEEKCMSIYARKQSSRYITKSGWPQTWETFICVDT
jgi:hypothetical protein